MARSFCSATCDGIVGEGREAAIGREEHALGAEYRDGASRGGGDLVQGLDAVVLLIDHADAHATVGGKVGEHLDLPGSRGCELEEWPSKSAGHSGERWRRRNQASGVSRRASRASACARRCHRRRAAGGRRRQRR
jgi:hypothetical protein